MNTKALIAVAAVAVIVVAAVAVYLVYDGDEPRIGDGEMRTEYAPGDVMVYNTEYWYAENDRTGVQQETYEVLYVTDDYILFKQTIVDESETYEDIWVSAGTFNLWLTVTDDDLSEMTGTVTVETGYGQKECEVWSVAGYDYPGYEYSLWVADGNVVYGIYQKSDSAYGYEMTATLEYTTLFDDAPEIGDAGSYTTDLTIEAGDVFEYVVVEESEPVYVDEEWSEELYDVYYCYVEILSVDGEDLRIWRSTNTWEYSRSGTLDITMDELFSQYLDGYIFSSGYGATGTERVMTYLGYTDLTLCQATDADGTRHSEWVDGDGNRFLDHTIVYEDGAVVSESRLYVLQNAFVQAS